MRERSHLISIAGVKMHEAPPKKGLLPGPSCSVRWEMPTPDPSSSEPSWKFFTGLCCCDSRPAPFTKRGCVRSQSPSEMSLIQADSQRDQINSKTRFIQSEDHLICATRFSNPGLGEVKHSPAKANHHVAQILA